MPISSRSAHCSDKVVAGFDHVYRYHDASFKSDVAKILPGEYYVTTENEGIITVLGSCISACIRDRIFGIGGMNHFMLPIKMEEKNQNKQPDSSLIGAAERYGNFAMEHLINEIMKMGGRKENFEVKVFGGGNILKNSTSVGQRNIEFVRSYLSAENLEIIAEDVGDVFPRKVLYFPATGVVKMKKVRSLHGSTVASVENKYLDEIKEKPVAGEIDLF